MTMSPTALDRLTDALDAALGPWVEVNNPPGLTWGIDIGGLRRTGALGHLDAERQVPARADTIYRISSMTKPVTAVAALALIEDGVLSLNQPIDHLIPELADRRVLRRPDGPLTETEPAHRPITVEDLLTFRLGHGMDFTTLGSPTPLDNRLAELGLGLGPPAPQEHLPPEEWLARLGSVPLRHQPGQRWLYNTGSEVLGVLLARACGTSLRGVLQQQVLDPLGMPDTGFSVPAESAPRFGACFTDADPETGSVQVADPPGGQWASPPPFEGGHGGLVSTADDYLSFAAMLRDGGSSREGGDAGVGRDGRVLTNDSVHALTINQLSDEQLLTAGLSPEGSTGWGYGVSVHLSGPSPTVVGSYGWDGGLGSTWRNDTSRGLSAVLLTNQRWDSPEAPPVAEAFWATLAQVEHVHPGSGALR